MSDTAGDRRDTVEQGEGLGDVVDVGRRSDDLERDAAAVADQVVLAAGLTAVDWRWARRGALFFARTWEVLVGTPATNKTIPQGGYLTVGAVTTTGSTSPYNQFNGAVHDVQTFDTALNPRQAMSLYTSGSTTT